MSTLDLFNDTFPHGTPDGYRQGCRTIACPALIPCRTVHTRYSGDYTFARMIDAGTPLSEILERDAAAKEGIQQRDRAAARQQQAAPAPRRAASKPKAALRTKGASHPATTETSPPAPAAAPIRPLRPHPGYEWLTRAAADIDKIPEANRAQRQQDLADYRTALDRHVAAFEQWRQQRATLRRQVAAAAATLRTATIAAGSGLSVNGAIESALQRATAGHQDVVDKLARLEQQRPTAPRKPRPPRAPRAARTRQPRQLQPHGTNACRARGCDRPECIEAARVYHREWMDRRKAETIPLEHHGSAYGYQLGCKDRETCPAEISCADASLAEERRRRRDAGIAEQAPRVPAEPVREHVRQLMAAGMTVIGIAEAAGVSKTGVKILLYGRSGARKGELPREIEEAKAQRILDLQPSSERLALSA